MSNVQLRPRGASEAVNVTVEETTCGDRTQFRVRWNDESVEVQVGCTAAGAGWIRRDGRTIPFYVARDESTISIWVRGQVHAFELQATGARRVGSSESGGIHESLTAPMPGTVLQIKIKEGEEFVAHQPLMILESMKMEMTLSVPHAGAIDKISCTQGQLVEMGELLATLREPGDG